MSSKELINLEQESRRYGTFGEMLQQVGVVNHRELLELERRLVDSSSETLIVLHHVDRLFIRTSEKMVVAAHYQSPSLLSAHHYMPLCVLLCSKWNNI